LYKTVTECCDTFCGLIGTMEMKVQSFPVGSGNISLAVYPYIPYDEGLRKYTDVPSLLSTVRYLNGTHALAPLTNMPICTKHNRFQLHYNGNLQCWGSVTFWYGSGSPDPYLWLTDPDADPEVPNAYRHADPTDRIQIRMRIRNTGTFTSFFKKKLQNSRNQGFSYHFCLMREGAGAGSVLVTNGSGYGSGSWSSTLLLTMCTRRTRAWWSSASCCRWRRARCSSGSATARKSVQPFYSQRRF